MANLGDLIATVENGWQRFDDNSPNINYIGNGWNFIRWASNTYGTSTAVITNPQSKDCIRFNFLGSKIRLYGVGYSGMNTGNNVLIDGVSYPMAQWSQGANNMVFLSFEHIGLDFKEHSVLVYPNGSARIYLDALDIDDNGELLPYTPISSPADLTVIAGDSQVTLSWDAVGKATGYNIKRSTNLGGPYTAIATDVAGATYVDNTVTNGTTYYYVVTAVNADGESTNSNEVSATPMAISKALLRVSMIDSSEREYRLSSPEIDGFINWYTRTIGTGISCYAIDDIVDDSKEYLSFEKIISFKVIPLAK